MTGWKKIVSAQLNKDIDLCDRRELLRVEYANNVAAGFIRPPSRTEKLISTAHGHEDLESTQAARRILEKNNIDYRNETPYEIDFELFANLLSDEKIL